MKSNSINQAIEHSVTLIKQGEVIAYPTEAVFGLGCDPFNEAAVQKLFHVKQRPFEKGVILIAASQDQIQDLVKLENEAWQERVQATWPGPFTWVLPVNKALPDWITGGRDTVAVRVSDHPIVQALCLAFGGPIVSTSANISGQPPARSCAEVDEQFKQAVFCIPASVGTLAEPSQIWRATDNKRLR